jgi:general nucleoside transport system ATP-binding protein
LKADLALQMAGVRKSFGAFRALDDASLDVRWGEVHAILGENGAGKSTLMNVAAGLYSADAGALLIDGVACVFSGPRDAIAHGVGMIHQHFKLVNRFNAVENVMLASPRGSYRRGLAEVSRDIRQHADALGFSIDLRQPVGLLSIAEQQRVEIIKALVAGARILILDEPTAVLADDEAAKLLQTVNNLARNGMAAVLVTHKLRDVQAFANRVTVMRAGHAIATLDPRAVSSDELTTLAVGSKIVPPIRRGHTSGTDRLIVRGLSYGPRQRPRLHQVSFNVRSGEIYGIAGVGGNGQTELTDILCGVRKPVAGTIELLQPSGACVDLTSSGPRGRIDSGFATVPADRQGQAIASSVSIAENYAIAHVHKGRFGPWWFVNRASIRDVAGTAIREADVQGVRSVFQRIGLLSGGNTQKLVTQREFSRIPSTIVVHSPSRGLDVRACAAIHRRLLAARDNGVAVVLISEDLDEVLSLSDRIGVMTGGKIVAEFDAPADRQAIGRAMVGHA